MQYIHLFCYNHVICERKLLLKCKAINFTVLKNGRSSIQIEHDLLIISNLSICSLRVSGSFFKSPTSLTFFLSFLFCKSQITQCQEKKKRHDDDHNIIYEN